MRWPDMWKVLFVMIVVCSGIMEFRCDCAYAQAAEDVQVDYIIGPDDVLDISVIKPVAMVSTVTVAPDGQITFPYIGNVPVEGLSLAQIQSEVQKRLADGYMEYPVVSVSLRETRSKKFTIYGQVTRPGSYTVVDNMTILQAVTAAGGFIVPGSMGQVKLLRPKADGDGFEVMEYDISSILSGNRKTETVQARDTIVVSVDKFFVYGQVNRPGAYFVEEKMTILHAITLAGGFIESGSTGRVKLYRANTASKKSGVIESDILAILNGAYQNVIVEPGDTIFVSLDKVFVSGQVNRPGAYPVEENMTLLQAITLAGGVQDVSALGRVKLIRSKSPDSAQTTIETSIKDVINGSSQNVTISPNDAIIVSTDKFYISGQVARPGEYPVKEDMTLEHAISVAGGFNDSGATGTIKLLRPKAGGGQVESVNIAIADILSGSKEAILVASGDTIVVTANKFYVYGEVMRPGMYPLEAQTSAFKALSMAGGFTKFGSASRVKILRKQEGADDDQTLPVNIKDIMAGNSKADILLQPGDVVVVSEGIF